jgi:hypothetical protein
MSKVRTLSLLLLSALALTAADNLEIFGHQWTVPNASDWSTGEEAGSPVLHLVTGRNPLPGPRRPFQFALADTPPFRKVTIEADAKPLGRSVMLVFAYRDPAHFDYAHFSIDTGIKQPVHNGVFHVYGGERVRISSPDGPSAFQTNKRWYHIKLVWDGSTGNVQGSVGGREIPALHAVDLSLREGKIGIGSFDETGDFKNVKITGTP